MKKDAWVTLVGSASHTTRDYSFEQGKPVLVTGDRISYFEGRGIFFVQYVGSDTSENEASEQNQGGGVSGGAPDPEVLHRQPPVTPVTPSAASAVVDKLKGPRNRETRDV